MINKDLILKEWDLTKVPSPSYILHKSLLEENLNLIDRVRRESGASIIVALKANAMWSIFPILKEHSDGATASSLSEARLVYEEMGVKAHTYAPVYSESEFDEILRYSSHIVFNSLSQYERFSQRAIAAGVSCGLRINPEYSTVETDLYNPSSPTSRLGVKACELDAFCVNTNSLLASMEGVISLPKSLEGLHFHSLCESRPNDLVETLKAVEQKFGKYFGSIKWLNMGGGHLMTHKDYDENVLIDLLKDFKSRYPHLQVILEPGSAFTWDTGVLLADVEDILQKEDKNIMMLNVSFACHMPDCLEMPYKPTIIGMTDSQDLVDLAGQEKNSSSVKSECLSNDDALKRWTMGGNSCLAGDHYGEWVFEDSTHIPKVGDKVVFRDMIHYTMVKTTMFNGVSHPSIMIYDPGCGFKLIRKFDYDDYKSRMG